MMPTDQECDAFDAGQRLQSKQPSLQPFSTTGITNEIIQAPIISNSVYQAANLDLKSREIRLVKLVEGSHTDIIRLKFYRNSLNDDAEYTTLSYM